MSMITPRMSLGMLSFAACLAATTPGIAQQVTLTSSDGNVNMTGTFKEFQGNTYVISTALGDMRIAATGVSCSGDACPRLNVARPDLIVGGSDTVGLALMPLLLEGYAGAIGASAELSNTGEGDDLISVMTADEGFGGTLGAILVNSTTSSRGFQELLAKEIEISMASRRIRPEEARELRSDGSGTMISPAQEHIVAIDSLIVITNPDNPVTALTAEQIRQIYSGQITNWSDVGGADLPIKVVTRPEGSGTRSVFEDRIFGDREAVTLATAIVADSNEDAADLALEDPGTIAFVSYAFQRGANALTLINDCGIATEPSAFSARTEEYSLQRRLYLYSRQDTLSDSGRGLLDYATSAAADPVIGKAGFIGFAVDRRAMPLDGARARALLDPNADAYEATFMRRMMAMMADYDRLSTTFRFRTGSSELDERGRIDKARLIEYLATQPAGTEIMMVGFTDSVGQFDGNLNLSAQRAAQVADELRATVSSNLPDLAISSVGFGEISPSGCNETEEGRRINRRVEVWIKTSA